MTVSATPTPASDRMLRRPEVEAMTGMSCSNIYRKMDRGEFPRPRRIGTGPMGAVGWLLSEVEEWMGALPVADPGRQDTA